MIKKLLLGGSIMAVLFVIGLGLSYIGSLFGYSTDQVFDRIVIVTCLLAIAYILGDFITKVRARRAGNAVDSDAEL
jgi:hypothetical protein